MVRRKTAARVSPYEYVRPLNMRVPNESVRTEIPNPRDGSDSLEVIEPCTLTDDQIDAVRATLTVGKDVEIMIPKDGQGVKDAPEGWFSLYLYPFTVGLSFSFPNLVRGFLKNLGGAFTQVMPYAWRVLLTTQAMCGTRGVTVTLGDLTLAYRYRSLGDGTYTLRGQGGRKGFVHMTSDKDKGWKGTLST